MYAKRIIPCLDVKNGRVVKGVSFVNIRDAGDPVECAIEYNKKGADELVLLDITATHEGRGTMLEIVRQVADNIFIPFTVGGGIRTVEDFKELLRAGADKISVNSAAVRNPNLINEAAYKFGSQCVQSMQNETIRVGRFTLTVDEFQQALMLLNGQRKQLKGEQEKSFLQVWIVTVRSRAMITNLTVQFPNVWECL